MFKCFTALRTTSMVSMESVLIHFLKGFYLRVISRYFGQKLSLLRVIVKVVWKVDLWAHVLRVAPSLARAEVRLGPRGSAKRILEDAGCEAQKSSVAGNHFFLVPPKRFPGAWQPSSCPKKLIHINFGEQTSLWLWDDAKGFTAPPNIYTFWIPHRARPRPTKGEVTMTLVTLFLMDTLVFLTSNFKTAAWNCCHIFCHTSIILCLNDQA